MAKRHLCLALVLGVAAMLGGCGEPEPEAVVVAPPPVDVYASPAAVTRAVLECIQDELKAAAARDKLAAARCRERLVALAAKDDIEKRIASNPMFSVVVGDDIVRGYTELWGAAIGYYTKEYDFDSMVATPDREDARSVTVRLLARGAHESTFLEVLCCSDATGRWGVTRIDFAKAERPRAAASQPAP